MVGWVPVGLIFGKYKLILAGGVMLAVIIVGVSLYVRGKSDGEAQSQTKSAVETVIRIETGAKAATQARKAQSAGRSPEDGVRSRDDRWE